MSSNIVVKTEVQSIVVKNADGRDGKSAYQQAVEGGYKGTEKEFNCSLSLLADIADGKKRIAEAINIKGGSASADSSFLQLADDIRRLDDTFITYGITTNGNKIDWLKFVTTTNADVRSFIQEIDNDEIEYINTQNCFENCINLTKIRFSNLTKIKGLYAFKGCTLLSEIECENLLEITNQEAFSNCPNIKELNLPNLISITGANAFAQSPLKYINIPKCGILSSNGIFSTPDYLINVVVGILTSLHVNAFGIKSNKMKALRNFTIGVNTDIDLPLYQWTADNVIAEGQSGIDELNSNLYNNLLRKLYDHSTDGQTRTLRIGWLAHVKQENIDYANSKGWTLTT